MEDTQVSDRTSSDPPQLRPGADPQLYADECKKWIVGQLYYEHPVRARDMSNNRRAELFDQGAQNLQRAASGYDASGNFSQWVDTYWQPKDPSLIYLPTPVFNEGLAARQNETARLARPNYRPVVNAKGLRPDLKARLGASTMQDALRSELRRMENDKDMSVFYYLMPIHGGAWLKSELVISYEHTTIVPVMGAVECARKECDFKLASAEVNQQEAQKLKLGDNQGVGGRAGSRVQSCPQCPDHPPLLGFKPTMDEAQSMKDAVGRPMGQEVPLSDWEVTVPNDSDMFPRNMGMDMKRGRVDDWAEAKVEHLDWVAMRWPKQAGAVKGENAASLAKYHPVLGAPDVYSGMLSYKAFDNCTRIIARHRKPWMEIMRDDRGQAVRDRDGNVQYKLNRGRSIVMAGQVVLQDKPFLFESLTQKGKWIPRVHVEYVPWEFRDGGRRLRGLGLWDTMFDPQVAANDIRGQTQAVRQRLAVPLYCVLRSHNLEIKPMGWGLPGAMMSIDVEPGDQVVKPELINNTTIDAGVQSELRDSIDFIGRAAGFVEVEKGQPPTGVSAGTALELLKGAASEKREGRLQRVQGALKRIWKHGGELIQATWIEGREIQAEDEDGNEKWRMVQATDFAAEVEVEIEGEPDYDESSRDVEVVRDMITNRIIDPAAMDRATKREVGKLMRAPKALYEKEDLQTDAAQREWSAFRESQKVPYVDPGLDDNGAHYEDHGRKAMTEPFRDLEEKARWDDALKVISAQWDEELTNLLFQSSMPGSPCLQELIYNNWLMQLLMASQPTPVMGPDGVTPEIGPDGLPATKPARFPVAEDLNADGADPEALDQVLVWRSHMEAHRLTDEKKQMRAMQAPTLPAPGAPATDQGTMPTAVDPAATSQPAAPSEAVA